MEFDTDFEQQEQEQPLQSPHEDHGRGRLGLAVWAASAATHAAALSLMAAIYFTVADDANVELPPATTTVLPIPPKAPPLIPNKPFDDQPVELPNLSEVVQPDSVLDVAILDTPPGDLDAPDSPIPAEKGSEQAKADIEMGSTAFFTAIGADGGAASKYGGAYASRGKRGKRGTIGAPPYMHKVTANALRWFKRHQSADGRWDADGYFRNCTADGEKCEPGKDQSGDTDVALTGYAVLCFLGDGNDHKIGTYSSVVRRGLEYLINNQKPDGLLGQRNYEHAIATMALAQAYGMSPDPWLREPVQKAVDVILARQNRDKAATAPYDRLGWDYGAPTGRNDASVTGWNVMALKAANIAGVNVGDGLTGCKAWLERSWLAANTGKPWCADPTKLDLYRGISRFGYVWDTNSNEVQISDWNVASNKPTSIASKDLAPVGLMCAAFMGHQSGDPMLESLGNYVSQFHQPTTWPCNTYYLYYNTLGMYQLGGERWETWASQALPMLKDAQRTDEGCLNGSWDWQGTVFHGSDTGRVLSTAYACLSMQVYWLYEKQVKERAGKKL
jgi:hypothetical protein